MQPIGPLMIEHRLIEQVITLLQVESEKIKNGKEVNEVFIDAAVDFIKIYADRTHHGKEEDILFSDLAKRKISEEDTRIMNELIEEHKIARNTVKNLVRAKSDYRSGDQSKIVIITEMFDALFGLYPGHITKEDKVFFPAVMKYYSKEEQEKMLEEMKEFDRKMIHEKYRLVVENLKT
jgi:hemerythrin-like domain-containing protein